LSSVILLILSDLISKGSFVLIDDLLIRYLRHIKLLYVQVEYLDIEYPIATYVVFPTAKRWITIVVFFEHDFVIGREKEVQELNTENGQCLMYYHQLLHCLRR
jgi:hypothetical protein